MKRIIMMVMVIIMVLGTTSRVNAAEVDMNMYNHSVFEFNHQYTVSDSPFNSEGSEVLATLKTGTIFAIGFDGLFITAASNIEEYPKGAFTKEVFFTKFEFESRDFFTNKPIKTIMYGYYDLLYIDYKKNIAVFKGDDFMKWIAKPLELADGLDYVSSYSTLIGYNHDKNKLMKTELKEIYMVKNKAFMEFIDKINSDYIGGPIISNGEVVGVYTQLKPKKTVDGRFLNVYSPNLKDILKAVDIATK